MTLKVAVYAIGALLAIAGCAQTPPKPTALTSQSCSSSPCGVAVGQSQGCWPFNEVIVPDEIRVGVANLPVTITWTLDSSAPSDTYFNPANGIDLDKTYPQYFTCAAGSQEATLSKPRSYSCTDLKGTPANTYKYTVRTKGWCSPPDKDPTVVNN